ncbi:hypothetical protein BB560_006540, partial [Smittium megazygosporum]
MSSLGILSSGATFNKKKISKELNINLNNLNTSKSKESIKTVDYVPHELDILNSENHQKPKHTKSEDEKKVGEATAMNPQERFEPTEEDLPFEDNKQVKEYRKENQIRVWGKDVPNPFKTFRMMMNRYDFRQSLESSMIKNRFLVPTQIQKQAIPISLD